MYSLSDFPPQYLNAGLLLLALTFLILLIATRRTLNQAHKNIAEKNDALLAQQQAYNETQERVGMLLFCCLETHMDRDLKS